MLDKNFSRLQKLRHSPDVTIDGSDHLANIIFSPFVHDDRKTSHYTKTIESLNVFNFNDWFREKVSIPEQYIIQDDRRYLFKISAYDRRLYNIKINGKVDKIELLLVESDCTIRTVQSFDHEVLKVLNKKEYGDCIDLPWSFGRSLKSTLCMRDLSSDNHLVLCVEGEDVDVVAEFVRLSSYDNQHLLYSSGPQPLEIVSWIDSHKIKSGDIIYGFKIKKNDYTSNVNFVIDNDVVLNCPEWSLDDGCYYTCNMETFDTHNAGIMYTSTTSLDREVIWLVGREFIV